LNQLGYYGKTPHRGDFVRFNLPQSFIKVWDDWLQQVMINGESQSQTWPAQYAQAPTYRFVLSSGIAGNTPWIGILKASQDKVGRRFPFCLALSLPEHELPCVSVSTKALWFDEAEVLLTRVVANEYNFDDLQGELALMAKRHSELAMPTASPTISLGSTQSSDDVTISVLSSNALGSNETLPSLLDTVLQQTLGEYSLWMASSEIDITAINAGLPINNAGLALFNSDWKNASTAHIDLKALPASLSLPEALPTNSETELSTAEPGTPTEDQSLESTLDRSLDDTLDSSLDTTLDSTLDVPLIVPDVEPMELDEDDAPLAPWER
jgi:type VI secretion system protein ImpM